MQRAWRRRSRLAAPGLDHRSQLARVTTAAVLAGLCACSDEAVPVPVTVPPTPAPWDDDTERLAHCAFEPAPAREARPAAAPTAIRAGVGSSVVALPIGTPLGGYGSRVKLLGGEPLDARASRWATAMVPTAGIHDAPRAEAVALEAGGETAVLVRVDAPLVTENALFDLEKALAPDGSMRGRILLTASHSHAAWAGWQPSLYLMPGIDRPRTELLVRVVEALRQAAQQALDSLAPARVGFAVAPDFDPDGRLTNDRRGENDAVLGPDGNTAGSGKDPVAWAMRVDRDDGQPLVALVGFPVHGTIGSADNVLVSTDVIGPIERSMSHSLGFPVFHVQGAAGDATPVEPQGRANCPDAWRCLDMPTLEYYGALAGDALRPLVESVETESAAALEIVTRTFPIGRGGVVERPDGKQLWYLPPDPSLEPDNILLDADGTAKVPFDEFNAAAGAGQCGDANAASLAPIPGSPAGLYSSCIDLEAGAGLVLSIFGAAEPETPMCDTARATAAALRISGLSSGDWMMLAMPGEATAPLAHYLRARSPYGPERTLLVGYADEHAGYLLTAEDWLAGGYECSTNLWGPREGEQIVDGILEAAAIAATPELEDPEANTSRFEAFEGMDATEVAAKVTGDHGLPRPEAFDSLFWPDTIGPVEMTPPQVPRAVGVVRFAWYGGDPAVDFPEVVVERETAPGMFEAVADEHGRIQSSFDGVVVVTYTPEPLEAVAPDRHVYGATWQPVGAGPLSLVDPTLPFGLPKGRYRLRVVGQALASSGIEAYTIDSPPVEIVDAPLGATSSAKRDLTGLLLSASLGSAPGLRALSTSGPSDDALPLPGPWTVTVTKGDGTTMMTTVAPDPGGSTVTVELPPADVAAAVSVTVRDPFGNGGDLVVR